MSVGNMTVWTKERGGFVWKRNCYCAQFVSRFSWHLLFLPRLLQQHWDIVVVARDVAILQEDTKTQNIQSIILQPVVGVVLRIIRYTREVKACAWNVDGLAGLGKYKKLDALHVSWGYVLSVRCVASNFTHKSLDDPKGCLLMYISIAKRPATISP